MQTFLPYPDFEKSAQSIDRMRCGKQRVEGMQLLNILNDNTTRKGWSNHPATKMWRGHRGALKLYVQSFIDEWVSRGYKNNIDLSIYADDEQEMPEWFGSRAFHRAHKSNLIRKQLESESKGRTLDRDYIKMWSSVPADLPYVWPV